MVEWFRRHVGHGLGVVFLLGLFLWPSFALATTQVGNAVLQAWYRQRHTFQTDGGDHLNWVQWRNEFFGWLVYDNLVEDGLLFNQIKVPFVQYATLNARYRFRYDPVYQIRDHFSNLYDDEEKDSFIIPENGFRDAFIDLDFERVGPGNLSVRIGNQQIVWGESDLFRSLDVINPLRIDQNGPVGEKFDEFRSPSFAVKFLYDLGTIGTWFSDVGIEPWYSPRYRTNTSELILEDGFRLPAVIKGCLDENGNEVPFELRRCSELRSPTGERVFVQQRPSWVGRRRKRAPWSIFPVDGNDETSSIDYACLTQACSPDVVGHRGTAWVNLVKSRDGHVLKGTGGHSNAGGVRILAKTFFNWDITLNYMFISWDATGVVDLNKPLIPYGDADDNDALGSPFGPLAGDFEEGLRRCVSDGGKQHESQAKDRGARVGTILVGADLRGYNHPDRFRSNNPNGALDDSGNPVAGRHQAVRPPFTFCVPALHDVLWTHVAGFTATYNDFKYTGAVFRFEQSLSSKEGIRAFGAGSGRRFFDTPSAEILRNNTDKTTRVWRSMVGFDLVKAFSSLRYIPGMPATMYQNQSFFTGQWLMENYWDNVANNVCQNSDHFGNGLEDAAAADPALRTRSNSQCRRYRWNHLLTFAWAGYGFFGGRMETRNAVVMEPRSQSMLLFTQNWWRNLFGYRNLEASFGVGWYPSSSIRDDWTGLVYYQDRDQFWFEMTYYLL